MMRMLAGAALAVLLPLHTVTAQEMTVEQIREVIEATDAAARARDTQGIGRHLSKNFEKQIEVPDGQWLATAKIDKEKYLALIDRGWKSLDKYSYWREDTVIHIAADGLTGESASTITETSVIDGEKSVSKVREYARYAFENGRPVITHIQGHTLVGDTTRASGQ